MAVKLVLIMCILLQLAVLLQIQGVVSLNVLESNPTQIDGVLTACAGQQISLTCSHSHAISSTTQWRISPPVNCAETLTHISPHSTPCGQFMLIVPGVTDTVLSSTAVATADVNMIGSVVHCIAGNAAGNFPVGNISLCIVGQLPTPTDVLCQHTQANGFGITWTAVFRERCAVNRVGYNLTIANVSTVVYTTIVDPQLSGTTVNNLQPGVNYTVSVKSVIGSCLGKPATIICPTSAKPTITVNQRLIVTIAVPVIVVIILIVIVAIFSQFCCGRC